MKPGRRITILTTFALALAALVAAAGRAAPERPESESVRERPQQSPNVIVVMTDDQNDSLDAMPAVQKVLAARGTTFTRAFVSMPLCCPSRATFITGQYAHNHGVFGNEPTRGGGLQSLRGQKATLPVWLRRVGYRTAHVGKYLNGYGRYDPYMIPPGWKRWFTLTENRAGTPLPGGEQFRYGFTVNADGRVSTWPRRGADYITDVLRRKALKLIDAWARSPRPFFLWFTPSNPHGEPAPPGYVRNPRPAPRHQGIYELEHLPAKPSLDEEDVSDKPAAVRNRPRLSEATIADLDLRYRSRLESLLSVDEAIAAMVRHLRSAEELRDTVIIFTSDNGLLLGEHRLVFKGFLYEEAINVPLIIRGPGFPAGVRRPQVVGNVDLAPTILQIAGRPVHHRRFDGLPLQPFAESRRYRRGRALLLEEDGTAGVRTRHAVYIHNASGERELYDLRVDPFQLQNRAASPAYAAERRRLARLLRRLRDCAAASCR